MLDFANYLYANLFQGRLDTYALQRRKGDEIFYLRVVGKFLTADLFVQHLKGEEILALYPLREDGSTSFACLDVDVPDLELAKQVQAYLPQPSYIEISRSGNFHIWMFFSKAVDTEELLQVCTPAINYARSHCPDHCNLYPLPQGPGQHVGVAIALPLQGNQVTQGRTVFIDADGKPIESQETFLRQLRRTVFISSQKVKAFSVKELFAQLSDHYPILQDGKIKKLFLGIGKKTGDRSRSGYDFALCRELTIREVAKEDILEILRQRPNVRSLDNGYLTRTVEAACRMIEKKNGGKVSNETEAIEAEPGAAVPIDISQKTIDLWNDVQIVQRADFNTRLRELLIIEKSQQELFDIFFATLIANLKTTGRPLWLLIIGPPGAGKTIPMMAVSSAPVVYTASAFRSTALISGWGMQSGQDVSLIPKLNGKVLLVKDMSSLLSQNRDVVAEILGLLRDAYDGSCSKPFGTGVAREYTSRFGFIGATTPEIDANWSLNVRLGERFLRYRVKSSPEQVYQKIDYSLAHLLKESQQDFQLEELCIGYLKYLLREDAQLGSLSMASEIGRLAQLGAILRTGVAKNSYNSNVLAIPEWEEATRFAKQLAKLALGLAFIREKPTNDAEEFEVLKALVRDGLDSRVAATCRYLYLRPNVTSMDIANDIHLPEYTIRQVLSDLEVTRVAVKSSVSGFVPAYDFTPFIRGQLDVFQLWSRDTFQKELNEKGK